MKKIMAFVAALVVLSVSGFGQTSPASAGTVITNGITLAMGSTNKVFDYLIKECNAIYFGISQNGRQKAGNSDFVTASSLSDWAQISRDKVERLVTNNLTVPGWLDVNTIFEGSVYVVITWDQYEPDVAAFSSRFNFSLVKHPDGTYHVPEDLYKDINFVLERSVPVLYAPEGAWARIEVTERDGQWVADGDNFIQPNDPSNGLIAFDGPYLTVRTLYACSGDSGPYVVKVILVTDNRYMVFDGNGNQVPETPIALSLQRESGGLKISVTGGDTYRMFSLQKSTDMKDWNTIATGMVPAHSVPWTFTDTSTVGNGFYRVLTVENQALRVALKSALK